MKNKLFIFLPALLLVFAGCGGKGDSPESGAAAEEAPGHYKSTMKPFDELVPAERIVILQNVFNSNTREGFYTRENRPASAVIEYSRGNKEAWPISHAIDLLHKGCEGKVAVTKTDGGKTEFSAADFSGMYVMIDFRSDAAPVLYNPTTKSLAADFAFAVTSEGEVIYSVISGAYQNAKELLEKVGWKTDARYRIVATDKFYVPMEPAEAVTGELRGALSGVVNGSFPDMRFANGKINDVLFIELIVE